MLPRRTGASPVPEHAPFLYDAALHARRRRTSSPSMPRPHRSVAIGSSGPDSPLPRHTDERRNAYYAVAVASTPKQFHTLQPAGPRARGVTGGRAGVVPLACKRHATTVGVPLTPSLIIPGCIARACYTTSLPRPPVEETARNSRSHTPVCTEPSSQDRQPVTTPRMFFFLFPKSSISTVLQTFTN